MPSTYTPIATTTLGSAASSVTFSSISGSYTDLVLVINFTMSSTDQFLQAQFNSDSSTNYSVTNLFGDGTTAGSNRSTSATSARIAFYGSGQSNAIVNIMNYSNSTTYKTLISRDNTNTYTLSRVNLWRNTAAITSIVINASSGNIASGSTFTLYGVKSA